MLRQQRDGSMAEPVHIDDSRAHDHCRDQGDTQHQAERRRAATTRATATRPQLLQ